MTKTLYAVHRPRVVPVLDVAALLVGVIAAVWPGGVLGLPYTPGPYGGALWALRLLTYVAPVVTCCLLATVAGYERDHDLVTALHAVGMPADRRRAIAEFAVVGLMLGRFWAAAAGCALLAGTGDALRRTLLGPHVPMATPEVWPGLMSLPIAAGCLVLSWLVLVAVGRSGRVMLLLIGAVTATLFVWLMFTAGEPVRDWAVAHPLGGLWALAYPGGSPRLTLDVSTGAAWSGVVGWTAATTAIGGRALYRSG